MENWINPGVSVVDEPISRSVYEYEFLGFYKKLEK